MFDYDRLSIAWIEHNRLLCIHQVNRKVTQVSQTANSQTHVRATKMAAKRISRIGKKLATLVGGSWGQAAVVDKALDTLEKELSKPTNTVTA